MRDRYICMLFLFRHVARENHARTIRRQGEPGEIYVYVRPGLCPMPDELYIRQDYSADSDETGGRCYVDPVLRPVGSDIPTRHGVQYHGIAICQLSNAGDRESWQAYTRDDTRRAVGEKNISN